jgi:hypothetical protein
MTREGLQLSVAVCAIADAENNTASDKKIDHLFRTAISIYLPNGSSYPTRGGESKQLDDGIGRYLGIGRRSGQNASNW